MEANPVKEFTIGAASGVIGKLIEYPFDTVKVRLQTSTSTFTTAQLISQTYKREGIIHGFYQGIKAPLIGACLENAILFATYNSCLKYLETNTGVSDPIPLSFKCLSGGFAGFMASFMLTPIELVKCQLQVKNLVNDGPTNHLYSTIIRDVIKKDGVKGLWNGLGSTLIREINGTAIWFATYEVSNSYLSKTNPGSHFNSLVSGALSGITFNSIIFPIDTIKSNVQTNELLHNEKTTYIKTIRKLGVKRLYSGLGITLLRSIPANAMIFYSYEFLKRNLEIEI